MGPAKYKSERFKSAEEFLNALRPSGSRWNTSSRLSDWIFRGHQRAEWRLLPALAREPLRVDLRPLYQLVRQRVEDTITSNGTGARYKKDEGITAEQLDRMQHAFSLVSLQSTLVRHFRVRSDAMGHQMPKSDDALWKSTGLQATSEMICSYGHPPGELEAIAQHHGVPTLLLDWTYSPYTAAYFAASDLPSAVCPNDTQGDLAVWAFRYFKEHADVKVITTDYFNSYYLRQQQGLFTWNRKSIALYGTTGHITSLEEVEDLQEQLIKLSAPRAVAKKVLHLLQLEGIDRVRLMPSLDVIGSMAAQEVLTRYSPTTQPEASQNATQVS